MLCEKILGNCADAQFSGKKIDYVNIEWHEAFSKLHRKTSTFGDDVGIRMGNDILSRGLLQGDVIYADDEKIIVVNIPECEAIKAVVKEDHPAQIAKLCYEIGNTHTSLFRGDNMFTFYAPYHEALYNKLSEIHGVTVEKVMMKFDFSKSLSSSINNHHH